MSERLKVLCVLGTRPEAVKMAPVIAELRSRADRFTSLVCSTGQHREMLDQILGHFGVMPDFDLDLMRPGQSPSVVAASVLQGLEPILERERPDWVLVQGDTTTAAAAAVGAFYARSRVGHVEAGLRTYDMYQPFPEEANRRLISSVAQLHFAPTPAARHNLHREGVPPGTILVTGNTVVDALQSIRTSAQELPTPAIAGLDASRRLIFVTAHRRENLGRPLEDICAALRELAVTHPGAQILYAVHLNPRVSEVVHATLGGLPNVLLTPPLDYLDLVSVMRRCHLVLTDSGGIQEEAPSFGKPVLVLREVTERPEAVEVGAAKLVGTDRARIVAEATRLLEDDEAYAAMARPRNPFGDGQASRRIAAALLGEPVADWQASARDHRPAGHPEDHFGALVGDASPP